MSRPDRMNDIEREIDQTKGVMQKNIQTALDRGEKLENLEGKAEVLQNRARTFHKEARSARRAFCFRSWRNMGIVLFVLILIAVVLYFIIKG